MKKLSPIYLVALSFWLVPATLTAQSKSVLSKEGKDTSILPRDKILQAEKEAESYLKMAQSARGKFKSFFPSKPGDTVYIRVSGIVYSDPNLKLLKDNIDEVKNTRKLTSSYKSGTTVVKIVYKGGNASALYDHLGNAVKELFIAEDIEGNRMVLTYKMSEAEKTPETDPQQ